MSTIQHYVGRGQFRTAQTILGFALERFPESNVLINEVKSVKAARASAAIWSLESKLGSQPSLNQLTQLCDLHHCSGDDGKAMEFGRRAILENPSAAKGYQSVGRIYFEQFRADQGSIEGMNALRYLSKAHCLEPRNSNCLLQLAEILLILHAPNAAMKFLGPVERAFPENSQMQSLLARAQHLPPEETTQLQDLILWHEQRLNGERALPEQRVALPTEVVEAVEGIDQECNGTLAVYLIDGGRNICAGKNTSGWVEDDLAEAFGMLADTVHQNCRRMGIGSFNHLFVKSQARTMMLSNAEENLTAFIVGDKTMKRQEARGALRQLCKLIGNKPAGVS